MLNLSVNCSLIYFTPEFDRKSAFGKEASKTAKALRTLLVCKGKETKVQWCVSPETDAQKCSAGGLQGHKRVSPELSADLLHQGFLLVALSSPPLTFIQLFCRLFGQGLPVSVCLTSVMRYWFHLDVTVIWITGVLFVSYKFWRKLAGCLVVLLDFFSKKVFYFFYRYEFGLHSKDLTPFFFFCCCPYFRSLTLKTALLLSLRF